MMVPADAQTPKNSTPPFISFFTLDVIAVGLVALQRGHVPENTILHPENRDSSPALGSLTQNGKLLDIYFFLYRVVTLGAVFHLLV